LKTSTPKPLFSSWCRSLRSPEGKTVGDIIESRVVTIPEAGCWLLPEAIGNWGSRYGYVYIEGENLRGNRAAFAFYKGDIESGMHVLHKCDTPGCVNPDHLFVGTQAENNADRDKKGRARFRSGPVPYKATPKHWIQFEYKGIKKTLDGWAKELGVQKNALYYRVYRLGWSIEEAILTPKIRGKQKRPLRHLTECNEGKCLKRYREEAVEERINNG
jgi:hypothetical protein